MEKISILDIGFHVVSMREAKNKLLYFLTEDRVHKIYTPNPEIVMEAKEDEELSKILNRGDLVVADGIGVIIGSKILKNPLPERVGGYDLVQNLLGELNGQRIFFFGGSPQIAKIAAIKMKEKYGTFDIAGTQNGYFNEDDEALIVENIKNSKPDIVLVGLGAPKQEKWIEKYSDKIGAKIFVGVGGSFDVMAGRVKRAPQIFIKLNLEWFYRLISQPKRAKRMLKIPKFLFEVLKIKKSKERR